MKGVIENSTGYVVAKGYSDLKHNPATQTLRNDIPSDAVCLNTEGAYTTRWTGTEYVNESGDIESINNNWKKNYIDIIKARDEMTDALMNAGGFESLNNGQKYIISKWFLASYEDRMSVITEEQDKINWVNFLTPQTKIAREKRVQAGRKQISYELESVDANDLWDTVKDLFFGFIEANTPNLIQWITNEAGSPYENDGFAQKSYYTDERRDLLVDILVDGNY